MPTDDASTGRKTAPSAATTGLAVAVTLIEIAIGVLSNHLTTVVNAVSISFAFLALLLVAAIIYQHLVGRAAGPGLLRSLVRSRWWPPLVVSSVGWLAMSAVLIALHNHDQADVAAACSFTMDTPGAVQPEPDTNRRLTFCPTRINKGRPIIGDFAVEGQVLGPAGRRESLLLAVVPDPTTCDAKGTPGSGTIFVLADVSLATSDGSFAYTDTLGGYPEGVTLGRTYEFITAGKQSLDNMKQDHNKWNAEGNDPSSYGGIKQLPQDAAVLAKFYVPGGKFSGKTKPCS